MSKKDKSQVDKETVEEVKEASEADMNETSADSASCDKGSEKDPSAQELAGLKDALLQKESENKELLDRMQRLAAEFDNFRKRTQKEKEKLYGDSCADVISKFLPVVDNMERAIKASEGEEGQSLKDGVVMVFKQLSEILDKLGVKAIETIGQTFDPNLHNAVMHVEDEAYGASEIVDEFQKGYIYKEETVIRHSMVKVAN